MTKATKEELKLLETFPWDTTDYVRLNDGVIRFDVKNPESRKWVRELIESYEFYNV